MLPAPWLVILTMHTLSIFRIFISKNKKTSRQKT